MAYRKKHQQHTTRRTDRVTILGVLLVLAAFGVMGRLFLLQVLHHSVYVALAEDRDALMQNSTPTRGQIYFRDSSGTSDLLPVATNRDMRLIYAVPKEITDPATTAQKLATVLAIDVANVQQHLSKPNDTYEPLVHEVTKEDAQKVQGLALKGIYAEQELTRYYPFADMMSQLTGFVGYKNDARVGQYGVEGAMNTQLAGIAGNVSATADGTGKIQAASDGDNIVLTIDRTVQYTVCKKLQEDVEKHSADGGTVIVVDPKTGALIAMCTTPSFDANTYTQVPDIANYTNPAVSGQYEPGSVMKTMTMAAGIDAGAISPDTTFDDTGSIQIGKYTIHNSENKKYGTQTMSGVLEQSINTGAVFVERTIGQQKFRSYMEKFGLGVPTGIELQGEAKGDISTLKKNSDIYPATASFGQGVSVTPMQMLMAYAAIANGGKLMKPYIVDSVIKPDGYTIKTQPKVIRQVVTESTARTVMAMLINVVRKGHGKRAAVPGYYIGGKTGTAQIPLTDRAGYDPNKHIGTFVGYGSMSDPRFVMLTKIINPKDVAFAESSAAPLFGDIASFLVQYYHMTPDDTSAK